MADLVHSWVLPRHHPAPGDLPAQKLLLALPLGNLRPLRPVQLDQGSRRHGFDGGERRAAGRRPGRSPDGLVGPEREELAVQLVRGSLRRKRGESR